MRPIVLAATAAVVLLPSSAVALSCALPDWEEGGDAWLLPRDGTVNAPVDTLLWLVLDAAPGGWYGYVEPTWTVTLVDEVDEAVEVREEGRVQAGDALVVAYRPDEELPPDRSYTFAVIPSDDSAGWLWPLETRFTTGLDRDDEAPEVPAERSRTLHVQADELHAVCNTGPDPDYAKFDVWPIGDLTLLGGGHLQDDSVDHDPDGPWTDISDFATGSTLEVRGRLQPATRLEVRFGALDLSGNFSGWSEPTTATMPLAGCTSSRSAALPLLLLCGAGVGLRRRDRDSANL